MFFSLSWRVFLLVAEDKVFRVNRLVVFGKSSVPWISIFSSIFGSSYR